MFVREKHLPQSLYDFGVTCSYNEVVRFKASTAAHAESERATSGVMDAKYGLVQAVADNFDATISSQNGLKSTHALALLFTQVKPSISNLDLEEKIIKRLSKDEVRKDFSMEMPIQCYKGPEKPPVFSTVTAYCFATKDFGDAKHLCSKRKFN